MMIKKWDDWVWEDHQVLEVHVGALKAALALDISSTDRRIALQWFVRNMEQTLEQHLRKDREIFIPKLEEVLKLEGKIDVVGLLREQHQKLWEKLTRLGSLLRGSGPAAWTNVPAVWEEIIRSGEEFAQMCEDHLRKDRWLVEMIEFHQEPDEADNTIIPLGEAAFQYADRE